MTQTDPKQASKTKKAPAKAGDKGQASGGSTNLWYGIVILLVAAIVAGYWLRKDSEEPRPVASAAAEEETPEIPEGAGESTTAALVIDSNVRGADVYLNGNRVGKTPHKATPLAPGEYDVRVVQDGYDAFEERVRVETSEDSIHAELRPNPGASSAREDDEVAAGEEPEPVAAAADIRGSGESVAVKHKHRIGSCEGVLRAGAEGVRFETDHKDAFFVAYSNLEELTLDDDKLTVKVREGRKYDFSEMNDDREALAAFHQRAGNAVANADTESR